MKERVLLFACMSILMACSSSTNNIEANADATRSNPTISKTNVNAVNSASYSRSENAYTMASNSPLGRLAPSGKAAKEIVGKTATDIKLWQNETINASLNKLMGPISQR